MDTLSTAFSSPIVGPLLVPCLTALAVIGKAFQQALFGDEAPSHVAVTDQYAFEFHTQAYAPSRDYDGRFGHFDFRKHFYGRMSARWNVRRPW